MKSDPATFAFLFIHGAWSEPIGQLSLSTIRSIKACFAGILDAARITRVAAGVDFVINDEKGKASHFPHIFGLLQATPDQLAHARALIPPRPMVRTSLWTKRWDGDRAALAYAVKPDFVRREIRHDPDLFEERTVHGKALRPHQRLELLLVLDELGLSGRLLLMHPATSD